MKIRAATSEDIPALIELDRTSSTAAHWTPEQYRNLFQIESLAHRLFLVAESERGPVIGFLVAQHVAPEWELENIVVSPTELRRGIGRSLLNALLQAARQSQSDAIFLEVRESNRPARAFYESSGFRDVGRRKAYYSNPVEDAILYRTGLY